MNQKIASGIAVVALLAAAGWMYTSFGGSESAVEFEKKQAEAASKIVAEQQKMADKKSVVEEMVKKTDSCDILGLEKCDRVSYAFSGNVVDVVKTDTGSRLVVSADQIIAVNDIFYAPEADLISYAELLGITLKKNEVLAAKKQIRQTQRGFLLQVDLPQGTTFIGTDGRITGQLK